MDIAALSLLLSPGGWALLERLPPYSEAAALSLGDSLRREGHDPALVAAALTQSRLRDKARGKFGAFAEGMLFTPAGLEQATRLPVAARHAQRFAAAGVRRVADLGCGIGADSMALAGMDREVLAVERDELTAAVATVNLRHWADVSVVNGDAREIDLTAVDGVFCDPARRRGDSSGSRRVFDPKAYEPPLSFATELGQRLPAVGVKVAPGIPHHQLPGGEQPCEAQWVSITGDVVECGLWFGLLATEGVRRSAVVVNDDGAHTLTDVDLPQALPGPVGGYLYEPDGAVIRSGLVGHVAAQQQGRLLDPTIAYITADRMMPTPFARAYAVEDVMPFQLKALRTYLRDRAVGRLTIKKRGTAVEPEQLRRQLRPTGTEEATIVLTRVAGQQSVLVVRPVEQPTAGHVG